MNPSRVFAVVILLLAVALLVQGYVIAALFAAVFGVLVFVAPHVRAGGSNDEGAIGHAGASSWPSGGGDGNRCNGKNGGDGDCGGGDGDGD
jgi:hypothetical protein